MFGIGYEDDADCSVSSPRLTMISLGASIPSWTLDFLSPITRISTSTCRQPDRLAFFPRQYQHDSSPSFVGSATNLPPTNGSHKFSCEHLDTTPVSANSRLRYERSLRQIDPSTPALSPETGDIGHERRTECVESPARFGASSGMRSAPNC